MKKENIARIKRTIHRAIKERKASDIEKSVVRIRFARALLFKGVLLSDEVLVYRKEEEKTKTARS